MKRRIIAILLVFLLVISLSVTVYASARMSLIGLGLSFEGTTAKCTMTATADYSTHRIYAKIGLYDGDVCVRSWTRSAYGILNFSENVAVTKGKTYVLMADVTVNGVVMPTVTKSGTCE